MTINHIKSGTGFRILLLEKPLLRAGRSPILMMQEQRRTNLQERICKTMASKKTTEQKAQEAARKLLRAYLDRTYREAITRNPEREEQLLKDLKRDKRKPDPRIEAVKTYTDAGDYAETLLFGERSDEQKALDQQETAELLAQDGAHGVLCGTMVGGAEASQNKDGQTARQVLTLDGRLITAVGYISHYEQDVPVLLYGDLNTDGEPLFVVKGSKMRTTDRQAVRDLCEHAGRKMELTTLDAVAVAHVLRAGLDWYYSQPAGERPRHEALAEVARIAPEIAEILDQKLLAIMQQEALWQQLGRHFSDREIESLVSAGIGYDDLTRAPYAENVIRCVSISHLDSFAAERGAQAEDYDRITGHIIAAVLRSHAAGHTWISCADAAAAAQQTLLRDACFGGEAPDGAPELRRYWDLDTVKRICARVGGDCLISRDEIDGQDVPPHLMLASDKYDEDLIAAKVRRLHCPSQHLNRYSYRAIEAEIGVALDADQRAALHVLDSAGVKVITGPAGTGKTSTVRAILAATKRRDVALCAYTSKAANVLGGKCGMDATTIHTLLHYVPGVAVEAQHEMYDGGHQMPYDLIIVDESSMIDADLMGKLLDAVKPGSIVVLIGDDAQLPPVGTGAPFRDLIDTKYTETYRLTQVHRNSGSILDNATDVRTGISRQVRQDDSFCAIVHTTADDCQRSLLEAYQADDSIMVITPIHAGKLGRRELNRILSGGAGEYKPGERLIFTHTNYDTGYLNGEICYYIDSVRGETITVRYDDGREVTYPASVREDLDRAESVTVHKSQGSEWQTVHVVLPPESSKMVTRELLYTAITRARAHVIIHVVGSSKIYADALKTPTIRRTLLAERLGGHDGVIFEREALAKLAEFRAMHPAV